MGTSVAMPEVAIPESILLMVVGSIIALWAWRRVAQIRAPRRWPTVTGTIVDRERDAQRRPVDVIRYPLAEGGFHEVRSATHGTYVAGRPLGTEVYVWRDPVDGLNAELEPPGLDRFAGPLVFGILGAFFAVGGLVWLFLLLALPR